MKTKYEKLELEDLPKSAVVNSNMHLDDEEQEQEVQELINDVVSEHLSKIVEDDDDADKEIIEKTVDDSLENNDNDEEKVNKPSEEVDIEAIKKESYERGLSDAKSEFEAVIADKSLQDGMVEKLVEKISEISPTIDFDAQIAKITAESISGIAKKLHLILPVNFEEIIVKGLIEKLNSFYKEGTVTLTIHPEKREFCDKILQSDLITSKLKDKFNIIEDEKLAADDCILDWNETRLEYNQEQIRDEIEKIIKQLGSANNGV